MTLESPVGKIVNCLHSNESYGVVLSPMVLFKCYIDAKQKGESF